ncbi:hypothetical protein D3C76_1269190 [compost metagenome]
MQRDINIRFRNQLAFDGDNRILRSQRCRHQQRRQELAGNAAIDSHFTAGKSTAKTQWRIVFLLQIINLRTALTQGIHQMTDRALFHAWLAG